MVSPEEIKSKEFLVSLRGYDRDEVHTFLGRVADELAQARSRAQQLEQQIEQVRSESSQAAAPAPAAAEPATESAMFAEIGRETQRILEAAQEAGNQMQRRARQDADKELQAARSQAARQIAEGERRREQIERVVEALDKARAALATDLRNVSRTIDNTLRELSPSETPSTSVREAMEVEARINASRAGAGAQERSAPQDAGDAPAEAATLPEAESEPEPAPQETSADAVDARAQDEAGAEEAAPALAPDEGAGGTAAEADQEAADGGGRSQEEASDSSGDTGEAPQTNVPAVDVDEASVEEPDAEETTEDEVPAEEPAAGEGGSEEPSATAEAAGGDAETEEAPAAEEDQAPAEEPAAEADTSGDDAGGAGAGSTAAAAALLDDSGSGPEADSSAEAAAAPVASTDGGPSSPSVQPSGSREMAGRDPAGLRAAALSPLHPKLVRKLKRELQEVQNIALDRVRRSGGRGEVDDFLPQGEDARILGEGAAEYLEQAWRAGVSAAGKLAERNFGDGGEPPALAGRFAEETSERVRASLGATLRMGMSAGEPPQALSDRIGAVFSELKGTSAEELSATHLIRAYEIGLLSTWQEGGVKARSWVLGREPRCPEARCRQNDQSGALPMGESFPSGHEVPPVHVGCTCTTVPITDS